eukprot:COSAG01_NODE_12549_length_1721_cov_9.601110_3_plen_89_part_00
MPGPRAHALLRRGPGSPAGEEEKEGGVGQEKKPCVIAPLRPLSNDGQTNHIPVGWGTRAPGGLGMQVGVQSNPSMTMTHLVGGRSQHG